MMRRPNPYANISLEPPPSITPNFDAPQMQFDIPQMDAPDTGAQVTGLGNSLLALKRRFGPQQKQIKGALGGSGAEGKFGY